jgi:hypothetical protein
VCVCVCVCVCGGERDDYQNDKQICVVEKAERKCTFRYLESLQSKGVE